ncbi:MAG: SDR family oxidoreductase [Hellea sp.]|nr:SDR family oxidoreductase [Hellea sp.]
MQTASRDFSKDNVLITGGGSGVGFEVAKMFLAAGATVTIMGRNQNKLDVAAKELMSGNIYAVQGDVANSSDCDQAVQFASEAGSMPVTILVNNAGVILRKSAEDILDLEWERVMKINVTGLFFMSRAAARQMPDGGVIVNLSSNCGRYGAAGLTAYCASKGAVDQITRTMALELAPRKITVNAVAPGAINSPMLFSEHGDPDLAKTVIDRNIETIPIGAVAEPEEIARAIIYLAGERHITGSILRIDGGFTA